MNFICLEKTSLCWFRILGVWQSLDIPVTNYIEAEYQGRGKLHGRPNEYTHKNIAYIAYKCLTVNGRLFSQYRAT